MPDIRKIMKQAQQMQEQMQHMQEALGQRELEGSAGGGMVIVRMNGRHEIIRVKIESQVVDPQDIEMLEDLIAAACNDARSKVDEMVKEEMGKLTGGLGLPPGMF